MRRTPLVGRGDQAEDPTPSGSPALGRAELVALAGLDVEIAGTPVLTGAALTVRAGETVGLVGPNGAGKTTLLLVLATLLRPRRGTGHILGADLSGQGRGPRAAAVRPGIALVGHDHGMFESMSLAENLRFVARLRGRTPQDVDRSLRLVGLSGAAERRVSACSHGMVRRAELARAVLTRPRLLLLDEAHAGLDEGSAALVDAVVTRVRQAGGAAVVVSHDQQRLRGLVTRVVAVRDGTTVDAGTVVS